MDSLTKEDTLHPALLGLPDVNLGCELLLCTFFYFCIYVSKTVFTSNIKYLLWFYSDIIIYIDLKSLHMDWKQRTNPKAT